MISDAELRYWLILWSLEKRMDDADLTQEERDEVIAYVIENVRAIWKLRKGNRDD